MSGFAARIGLFGGGMTMEGGQALPLCQVYTIPIKVSLAKLEIRK